MAMSTGWSIAKPPLPDHRQNPFPQQPFGRITAPLHLGHFGSMVPNAQRPQNYNIAIWR